MSLEINTLVAGSSPLLTELGVLGRLELGVPGRRELGVPGRGVPASPKKTNGLSYHKLRHSAHI